jgi:hypothetical protein
MSQCINKSIRTSNYDANTNPSNKYEMRRDNLKDDLNKLVVLSHVIVQYSYWPQMTLTLCCQAQKWGKNFGWKRSLTRYLAAVNDFSLMWSCHQECIIAWSNYFNWSLVRKKTKRKNGKHQISHNQNKIQTRNTHYSTVEQVKKHEFKKKN